MKLTHQLRIGLILILLIGGPGLASPAGYVVQASPPATPQGQLVTSSGERVSGADLRSMLDSNIPESNAQSRVIVATQCYGGNMVAPLSTGTVKTTVLSATSVGEKASYGGYDDNAAEALRPGAGRTSADVHSAGTAGKAAGENPTSAGPVASLEPVSPGGTIQSRHIVIYAGAPDSLPGRDISQRDEIIKNFKNQPAPTTTITTVGGTADNTNGWKYAGTKEGLNKALAEIKPKMGPNEQFILFITDHGSLQTVTTPNCQPVNNQCNAIVAFDPATLPHMTQELLNQPAVTLFSAGLVEPPVVDVQICQDGGAGECLNFPARAFSAFDANGDGDFIDPGDGWMVDLPVGEDFALGSPALSVTASGPVMGPPLSVQQVGLETGAISKGAEETPAQPHATLATSDGPSIYDDQLRAMLDEYIPPGNADSALLVFTQCFGGDMLDDFSGRVNTGVISATSPGGEEAQYGGYHDDAAAALYPGAGRSSVDVHSAGSAGKDTAENPSAAGGPISLEPVPAGPKTIPASRHVLFYAGEAGKLSAADVADRDRIVGNFASQPNTTVTTVGFSGGPGWNHPGTLVGLRTALQEISAQMGPNEQFILFVGDHGDYEMVDETPVCDMGGTCSGEPFSFPSSVRESMANDADNSPGVGIISQVPMPGPILVEACDSFFDICYVVEVALLAPVDLDGNGLVDQPGEGYYGRVDLAEQFILDAQAVMVRVTNPGGGPLLLSRISLESGEISRGFRRIFLPSIAR